MANPYYVEPANPLQGVMALSEGIGSKVDYERQKTAEAQKQQTRQQAGQLIQAGNTDDLYQLTVKNPWLTEEVAKAKKFHNDDLEANAIESAQRVLAGEPPGQVGIEHAEKIIQAGGDASQQIEQIKQDQQNPDAAIKRAETFLIFHAPKAYEALKKSQETEKPKTQIVNGQLVTISPKGSASASPIQGLQAIDKPPTSDFERWQKDPAGFSRYLAATATPESRNHEVWAPDPTNPNILKSNYGNEKERPSQIGNQNIVVGPNGETLVGEQFLSGIDKKTAFQVKALAEGRMQFPGGFALKTPYWQNMLSLVSQYDPSFDTTNYNKRAQTAKNFSSGKQGDAVRAINQTLHHMDLLASTIDRLDNSSGLFGAAGNYIKNSETGQAFTNSPIPGEFKQQTQAIASELRRIYATTGGGSEKELKEWRETFPLNASKSRQQEYLRSGLDLLKGAMDAVENQYQEGMGKQARLTDLLSPSSKEALSRLQGDEQAPIVPAGRVGAGPATDNKTSGGAIKVTAPDGTQLTFPNQQAADQFKKAAGLR